MKVFTIFFWCLWVVGAAGQTPQTDSLKQLIAQSREDTAKVLLFRQLGRTYLDARPDSCYYYTSRGLALAEKLHDEKGQSICLSLLGTTLNNIGNVPEALTVALRSLQMAERLKDPAAIGDACNSLGIIYYYQQDYRRALYYYLAALETTKDEPGIGEHRIAVALGNVGEDYLRLGMPDSCHDYIVPAWQKYLSAHDLAGAAFALSVLGDSYTRSGQDSLANYYYRQATPLEAQTNDHDDLCHSVLGMATVFNTQHRADSAAWYAHRSLTIAAAAGFPARELDAVHFLADLYESEKKPDSALKFLRRSIALKDSLNSQEKSTAIQAMTFQENIRQQQLVLEKRNALLNATRNRQRAGIAVFIPLFFLFVLFLSRRKVRPRLIEFLAVVGLLLAFEFITDLIFPFISDWTNDSPLWETVILVAIAAAIEPLNYRIEQWINTSLARRNFAPDNPAIRELEARFAAAFNAGDIDAIMMNYVPDSSLVVFDVVPRKEYRGADAYRADWTEFFNHFQGKPKIEISDLGITVDGLTGFGYSFQHVTGTDKQGHPVDRWVRVTDGYRKIGDKWLIALEHVSVPVDLATGKAAQAR